MFTQILQDEYASQVELEDCLNMAEPIVDPKLGIVKRVSEIPPYPGEPSFIRYTAVLSNIDRIFDCPTFSPIAGGASIYQKEAKMKALGEAIERYCAFIRFDNELIYASYEELGQAALDPNDLPMCSDKEYSNPRNYLVKPRRDVKMRWSRGFSLTRRRELLVPANLVYLSHKYSMREEMINLPISTGLACGPNIFEALISGLCEVVERDAFTVTWYHQLPVPKLDVTQVSDENITERLMRLEKAELEPFFFNITTEIQIPSILLILVSKSQTVPVLTVTTATHPDPYRALTKVIDEGVSTRNFCIGMLRKGYISKVSVTNPSEFTHLEDHLFAYVHPEMLGNFDFLLKNPISMSFRELPNLSNHNLAVTLKDILAIFSNLNMEVIAVDITTEDIKEAGFTVLRVLIPGLEPLSQDHNIRFLGRTRLYELPKYMGYDSKIRYESYITKLPHPFA